MFMFITYIIPGKFRELLYFSFSLPRGVEGEKKNPTRDAISREKKKGTDFSHVGETCDTLTLHS